MSARQKLNLATFYGILLAAGVIGAIAGSWNVFLILLGCFSLGAIYAGGIRLDRRNRRR